MRIATPADRDIGQFDIAPLRTPTSDAEAPLVLRTITSSAVLSTRMIEWAGRGTPQFNWPAVLSFNPNSITLALWTTNSDRSSSLEALMQIRELDSVPCQTGPRASIVYVSFLEVAPWNKSGHPRRRLVGVGAFMLQAACAWSVQKGFNGAIGLHALPNAIAFYEKLGFAPAYCPNEHHEPYYELDRKAAAKFIRQGGLT